MAANPSRQPRSFMDGPINIPIILAIYAASSLALGYGFADPVIDVLGLIATALSYLFTRRGVSRLLSSTAG